MGIGSHRRNGNAASDNGSRRSRKIRCAIYTRKSSEEGLDQEFNSLDAQREACAAYVESQKHEGWVLLPSHYDDGGISGGTLERAGLQQLLRDVDDGLVDQIVVYKIDRLTRSLSDFAKLVDRLDAVDASFVSVTQSFNTATSMGRLTLNVLLSFAQFEREVTAERIRDKIAASKRKGLWMGGSVPLGYKADGRTLKIVDDEAGTVRTLFDLYREHGNIREVKLEADRLGLRTKVRTPKKRPSIQKPELVVQGASTSTVDTAASAATPQTTSSQSSSSEHSTRTKLPARSSSFSRGHIHHILTNPVYAGRIRHKQQIFEGQHDAIIEPSLWEDVQKQLANTAARPRGSTKRVTSQSLLAGKLFDETGDRLTPSHANKQGKRYRYYVSNRLIKNVATASKADGNLNDTSSGNYTSGWRLPASDLELQIQKLVLTHLASKSANGLMTHPTADRINQIRSKLDRLFADDKNERSADIFAMIAEVRIKPGSLSIKLNPKNVGELFGLQIDSVNDDALAFTTPFQWKKRGSETRLIINAASPSNRDDVLITNIAKAHGYYRAITTGTAIDDLAEQEKISKARIMQILELAFLAPDIVRSIVQGSQPIGLTSNQLIKKPLPIDWDEQRQIISTC